MSTLKRTWIVAGFATLLIMAPASGAAFGTDGSAVIELDTTGLTESDAGGGGGGPTCTTASDISAIENLEFTQQGSYTYSENYGNPTGLFEFNSGSFPITWNPDICGVLGGTLAVTDFKTEASVNGTWSPLGQGFYVNGLPSRQNNSGVYNLDAIDADNIGGTFHAPTNTPTIATTSANFGSTTTNVKVTETLAVAGSAMLPNYRYVTTATFTVLADQ